MPHRNRVGPDGAVTASAYRGVWMGNRGGAMRVDSHHRPWASKHWIYCHLAFKDRTRVFRDPSRKYTELFFFDEAVALAAGHRPCGECQHHRLAEFKRRTLGGTARVDDIDDILHRQRRGPRETAAIATLPYGTFIAGPILVADSRLFRWLPETGYTAIDPLPAETEVEVLTPALIRTALERGFVARHRAE